VDSKSYGLSRADRAIATLSDKYHICDSICTEPSEPDIIFCGYCWEEAKSISELDKHMCQYATYNK
jgi:hypothetical protein